MDVQLTAGINRGFIWPEIPSSVAGNGGGEMAGRISEKDEEEEVLEERDVTMDASIVRGHMSEGEGEEAV